MNIIQKKFSIIAEIWDTCTKVMDMEVPEGEYCEFSFDFGYFQKYWTATNFDYKSLPCIKNTANNLFYHFNGLDFDFNGQCTFVFLESTKEMHNYFGAYKLCKPFRFPDFSAIDLDLRLLRSIADWLYDQWRGYESWLIENDKEDYFHKMMKRCEAKLDGDIQPASIIDPSFKENGCHQRCPNGYDTYNDDWFLSPNGDMCNRCSDYFIEADKLKEDDWILHCMERRWFDANTFIPAYWEACRRAGIKKVTMRIEY